MRKFKDAWLLEFEGEHSHQEVAYALSISKGVVLITLSLKNAERPCGLWNW